MFGINGSTRFFKKTCTVIFRSLTKDKGTNLEFLELAPYEQKI